MNILDMKHIKKSFDGKVVLQDIDLQVAPGEVVSILGPSGSGKSTLLRCATFLETIDSGSIAYNGKDVVTTEGEHAVYPKRSEIQEAQSNFGLVFQNFNLFPHYTVLKNIYHAPLKVQKRKDKDEVISEAYDLLSKVGLYEKASAYPCELSGGQQQRVAIARALALHPKIMYFDEPTSSLDPEITAEVLRLLKQLASEKMTMVIVTHEIDFAKAVSDRVIFMADGYIVEQGTPKQVLDNPQNPRTQAFLTKVAR